MEPDALAAAMTCGQTLDFKYQDVKGELASPGFNGINGSYPFDQHCEYEITLGSKLSFQYQMMLFELEDGPPDCIFDYFEIWKLPPRQTEWEPVLNRNSIQIIYSLV